MAKDVDLQSIKEAISTRIGVLYKAELDPTNFDAHTKASVKPCVNSTLSRNNQNLDILARLITSKDTCAAVCYDGDSLLLSNNTGNMSYAKQYMQALQAFVNEPFKANYDKLINLAYQEVSRLRAHPKFSALFLDAEKALEHTFSSRAFMDSLKINKGSSTLPEILEAAKKVIIDKDAPYKVTSLASEILRPVIDADMVANSVINHEFSLEIIQLIQILGDRIKFIEGDKYSAVHAEIRILQYLKDNGKLVEGKGYDISITKLACCPCFIAFKVLQDQYKVTLTFCGTHGGTYTTWGIAQCVTTRNMVDGLESSTNPGYFIPKGKETKNVVADEFMLQPLSTHFESKEELNSVIESLQKDNISLKDLMKQLDLLKNKLKVADEATKDLKIKIDNQLKQQEKIKIKASKQGLNAEDLDNNKAQLLGLEKDFKDEKITVAAKFKLEKDIKTLKANITLQEKKLSSDSAPALSSSNPITYLIEEKRVVDKEIESLHEEIEKHKEYITKTTHKLKNEQFNIKDLEHIQKKLEGLKFHDKDFSSKGITAGENEEKNGSEAATISTMPNINKEKIETKAINALSKSSNVSLSIAAAVDITKDTNPEDSTSELAIKSDVLMAGVTTE